MIYKGIDIKQHSNVTYLGCILGDVRLGELLAFKTLKRKIKSKLKKELLTPTLRRPLCNALMQSHFDYACSAWYPNVNQKLHKM